MAARSWPRQAHQATDDDRHHSVVRGEAPQRVWVVSQEVLDP